MGYREESKAEMIAAGIDVKPAEGGGFTVTGLNDPNDVLDFAWAATEVSAWAHAWGAYSIRKDRASKSHL